jgi:tRNA (cmo5U34)-methyltransferase
MSSNGDNHTPHADGKWHFDQSVTDNFDAMLSASIPGYQDMRSIISCLGAKTLFKSSDLIPTMVDWGASRGNASIDVLHEFVEANTFPGNYTGLEIMALEVAEPMLQVLEQRREQVLALAQATGKRYRLNPSEYDMRWVAQPNMYKVPSVWLAPDSVMLHLCVLTLQFVPTEYRTQIAKYWYDTLNPQGSLLLVEKVTSTNSAVHNLLIESYHDHKKRSGYSPEDIDTKRRALENSLVALTEQGNVDLLRGAGFKHVECVWRNLNFVAWIAVKE